MVDRLTDWGSITDVPGVQVGHYQRVGRGWRTGTTAVIVPAGATPGVDVRGGGPGTRETDALRPENLVPTVHAVCLTGGSAYGLAAADGVVAWLEHRRLGFPVGLDDEPEQIVPVVPAAVIFDLGRGGRFGNRPTPEFGWRAADRARGAAPRRGAVGAGAGAVAGGLQGGVGTAACDVGGTVVGALAVVNASGRVIDPARGLPWCGEGFALRRPPAAERAALLAATTPPAPAAAEQPLNTTIGVVATSAALTKAEASRLAGGGPRRPRPGRAPGPLDVRRRLRLRPRHRSRPAAGRGGPLPRRRVPTGAPQPAARCRRPLLRRGRHRCRAGRHVARRSARLPRALSRRFRKSTSDVASLQEVTSCPGEGTVE